MIRNHYRTDRIPLTAYGEQRPIPFLKNFVLFQGSAKKVDSLQNFTFKIPVFYFQHTALFPGLDEPGCNDCRIICLHDFAYRPFRTLINKGILIACRQAYEDTDKNQTY